MTSLVTVDATTGKRCSAASAYLEPNLHRKNLLVLTEAHVTKASYICILGCLQCLSAHQILFEEDGHLKRALGIECLKGGKLLRIDNVKRDVVIAAGTYMLYDHLLALRRDPHRHLSDSPGLGAFWRRKSNYSLKIRYRYVG